MSDCVHDFWDRRKTGMRIMGEQENTRVQGDEGEGRA